MTRKSFFGGLEGLTAKFLSLAITLVFFIIYTMTSGGYDANWFEFSGTLILFTLLYEAIGYSMYIFFRFFSRSRVTAVKEEDSKNSEIVASYEEKEK